MNVLIVGCGVSGLSTGIRLLEAGHTVTIVARDLPPHTTSNVAAAVWEPYEAYPAARVSAWGEVAYREFLSLAADPASGVLVSDLIEVLPDEVPLPEWTSYVQGFRLAAPSELPDGCHFGFAFRSPVIDTSRYTTYLIARFRSLGGVIEQRAVASFEDAFASWATDQTAGSVVINCAGLGARELAADPGVVPARGQVVRIEHTGFRTCLIQNDKGRPTYIVPRLDDIVLGGTFDLGQEDTTPDPTTRADILRRCAALALPLDPRFAMSLAALAGGDFARSFASRVGAEFAATPAAVIREDLAGLRPTSPRVRVEVERLASDRIVVHNYGHGGAGVTLSWGCAAEAASLVNALP